MILGDSDISVFNMAVGGLFSRWRLKTTGSGFDSYFIRFRIPKNIKLDIIIIKIDKGVPEILVLVLSIPSLAAIFQDGVPELLAPALKVILFDSEYQKTYS